MRSVLLVRKRGIPFPFFTAFNVPESSACCGRRDGSITVSQALVLLNDTLTVRMAEEFAARVERDGCLDDSSRIDHMLQLALSRLPTENERQLLLLHLRKMRQVHRDDRAGAVAKDAALVDLCRALFNTNEFMFVD